MIVNSRATHDCRPPNVIFVLADDLGWGDLGCYGHDVSSPDVVDSPPNRVMTPNIDRMAAEGKLFTRYYVNAPMCSPARAGLMTGVHPSRQGIHFWQNESGSRHNRHFGLTDYVDPRLPNLANTLRDIGYATAHFGKWHIGFGDDAPAIADYGFDVVKVLTQGNGPSYGIRANHPRGTEYLVNDTIDFVRRHKDQPFFANVWLRDVHAALDPSTESLARYRHLMSEGKFVTAMQVYFAAITEMDVQVGRLLDAVDDLSLGEDTIVIFSSDNGPEDIYIPHAGHHAVGLPGPFRGRKRSLYDGGVRVPFILRWKGHTPAGQVDDETVLCGTDLLPTLARLAGAAIPAGLDGEDMSDVFIGRGRRRETDLFWEWRYEGVGQRLNRSPTLAVLSGEWKLLLDPDRQVFELYHLGKRDDCELHSQHEVYPHVVESLAEAALAWRKTLPSGEPHDFENDSSYAWPRPLTVTEEHILND